MTMASCFIHDLLARVCARLRDGMQKLVASLEQRGFGMPYQAAQIPTRVEAAAFFGSELLARYGPGWRAVVARLNSVPLPTPRRGGIRGC